MLGHRGGGCLAPLLLCQELVRLGLRVTCFTLLAEFVDGSAPRGFDIVLPKVNKGHRWDWPAKCLAWQALRQIQRERAQFVFVMGVTSLARYFLQSNVADRTLIWEFTNANPGNKFVDGEASRLLSRCCAMLSPSHTIDGGIRSTYNYQGPVLRLPFWIEDEHRAFALPPAEFLADFIYLGRRDVEKGLHELIQATALTAKRFPHVRVLIAGPGSEEPFAAWVRENRMEANVSFHFFSTRAETMDALARSRCLILPSYHEGYPLVLLEAAQRSIPFIATRVGSVGEIFNDSGAGIMVPPKNAALLAQAMQRFCAESETEHIARREASRKVFDRLCTGEMVETAIRKVLDTLDEMNAHRLGACRL